MFPKKFIAECEQPAFDGDIIVRKKKNENILKIGYH